jgi:hypothetical protein
MLPIVNMLSGYQRNNRTDIKLFPRRGGSEAVANLGTSLIKHTLDMSHGMYERSDAFYDGLVCGKGWLGVDRNYENDPLEGDLVVEHKSPFRMLEDQRNTKYDVNKGRFVFEVYWSNRKKIELMFPRKASRLKEALAHPQWQADRVVGASLGTADDYDDDVTALQLSDDRDYADPSSYLIRQCWYKRAEKATFIVHLPTLRLQMLTTKQVKWAPQKVSGNPDFRVVERIHDIQHRVTSVGELVLEHIRDPLDGVHGFPYFRICPYLIQGYIMGLLDNLKDPQRELNKRRSQCLHITNTTAHSGWVVAKANNKADLKELERKGARPGFVLDKSKFGGEADRITPAPLDQAHLVLSDKAGDDIRDISGINTSLVESANEAKESGRAKALRQEAGMTISVPIFDNMARTDEIMGRFLWDYIRTSSVYSDQEIVSVVQENQLNAFQDMNDLRQAIQSMTLGRYGVRVSRSSNTPTVRMANYEQVLDAMKMGLPIPPEFLLELSDLPNKQEIIEYMRRMQQVPLQQPQQSMVRSA